MKIVTGKVRLSYANLLEPKSINGSEPKYSVSLIISKDDKETLSKIKTGIKKVYEENKSSKLKNKPLNAIKIPLRDGDEERPEDENYRNSYFVNCNATVQPGIVDRALNPIMDNEQIYSGMYARVSFNLYAFNSNGNIGIGCGLNNIQKLEDGERLDGRTSAQEDFADFAEFDSEDDLGF